MIVTAGQANDAPLFIPVMESVMTRLRFDGAKRSPSSAAADKAYVSKDIAKWLQRWKISRIIPTKKGQRKSRGFCEERYRARNVVERLVGRLKEFRRVATRYDKLSSSYLAFVNLAAIVDRLKVV